MKLFSYFLAILIFSLPACNRQTKTVSQPATFTDTTTTGYSQADSTCPLTMFIKLEKVHKIRISSKNLDKEKYAIKGDSIIRTKYDIQINLTNTSKKTVFISLMTCSWSDNFLVNNNYMRLEGQDCDHNFPGSVEFKAGETKKYIATLWKSLEVEYPQEGAWPKVPTTKLGLITLGNLYEQKLDYDGGYFLAMEDKSCWKIIWSNPLYLLSKKEATPDPITFDIDN
jgi:hypothetical protein